MASHTNPTASCGLINDTHLALLRTQGLGGKSSSSSRSSSSSSSRSSKRLKIKSMKSSKSPSVKGGKSPKYPKGKGGKGVKSSKSPKSLGKGRDGSKSSKSYGKGKGSKSNKSFKSPKSFKSAKSSKSPKQSKSAKGGIPTSFGPDPPLTPSPVTTKPTPSPTMGRENTSPPTKAPVVGPPTICGRTEEQRVEFINGIISGISGGNALNEANSPQARAAEWLINDDPIALCPDSNAQIVQRFSLATFYYSTDGDRWNFCRAATGPCPTDAQRFLSGASECEWYGIVCNASGRVLGLKLEPCKYGEIFFFLML